MPSKKDNKITEDQVFKISILINKAWQGRHPHFIEPKMPTAVKLHNYYITKKREKVPN